MENSMTWTVSVGKAISNLSLFWFLRYRIHIHHVSSYLIGMTVVQPSNVAMKSMYRNGRQSDRVERACWTGAGALCLLCPAFTSEGSQCSQSGLCQPGSKGPTGLLSATLAIYISLKNISFRSGCRMRSHGSSWVWRIWTSPLNGGVLGHMLRRRIRINSLFREFCRKIFSLCKLIGFYKCFEVHFPEALLRS